MKHRRPAGRTTCTATALRTTRKQRGGVTGKGFLPGRSGNPGGRPKSERAYLAAVYGEDGRGVYVRLEALRSDPKTPRRLQAQIDFFMIERLHGRAQQRVEVEGGASLVELLAEVVTRGRAEGDR
ncbi:MAG: hypothetical protein IMZ67_08680 [Acidobacteria bacterium]|nr:hypothetical protein [Acidobacteriota bacterium]